MSKRRKVGGFTLIEMLTVVVIIGILAGILFRVAGMISNRTARSVSVERLEQLKLCIEGYYGVYGEYPRATGVTWEEPGASAGSPEDWDIILPGAQAGDPSWENPAKEYWSNLYPFIYRDPSRNEWAEFSLRAGEAPGVDIVAYTNVNSSDLGFEYGNFDYTNAVHSIHDGQGNAFSYSSTAPYQSYTLTASDGVGEGWTQ
ncbi:MAG: type II secretion system protein [Kiritimatiellia bacterium]|nr:type II secretion system protein [Kiritimatiellia bacterium]MDP6810241.1 type II secretion system protein [Kiritimatiellia bacterium]MDP7022853.1 type II secretion system protein [Kiritimatiellia bacterium]